MNIDFFKYQGTGNDFVILDNRSAQYSSLTREQVAHLCNRRFGIGADGLMLLQITPGFDFEMVYFNADGGRGSMCGNGGRCLVAFARHMALVSTSAHFLAVDGAHDAVIRTDGIVELRMIDVHHIEHHADHAILNTGSPHYVQWINDTGLDVENAGRAIRYSPAFAQEGINVNFAKIKSGSIHVRTYERGVEAETLSCGTGVTAVALAAADRLEGDEVAVTTPGGQLSVKFKRSGNNSFTDVWLCGPAEFVFAGSISI